VGGGATVKSAENVDSVRAVCLINPLVAVDFLEESKITEIVSDFFLTVELRSCVAIGSSVVDICGFSALEIVI
jgi:hypothetical protein